MTPFVLIIAIASIAVWSVMHKMEAQKPGMSVDLRNGRTVHDYRIVGLGQDVKDQIRITIGAANKTSIKHFSVEKLDAVDQDGHLCPLMTTEITTVKGDFKHMSVRVECKWVAGETVLMSGKFKLNDDLIEFDRKFVCSMYKAKAGGESKLYWTDDKQ